MLRTKGVAWLTRIDATEGLSLARTFGAPADPDFYGRSFLLGELSA